MRKMDGTAKEGPHTMADRSRAPASRSPGYDLTHEAQQQTPSAFTVGNASDKYCLLITQIVALTGKLRTHCSRATLRLSATSRLGLGPLHDAQR